MQTDLFTASCRPSPLILPTPSAPFAPLPALPSTLAEVLGRMEGWTCDRVPQPDKRADDARGEVDAWLLAGVMQTTQASAWMLPAVLHRPAMEAGQRALVARLSKVRREEDGEGWLLAFGAVAAVRAPLVGRSGWGVVPLATWTWSDGGRGLEDARGADGVSPLVMPEGDVAAALAMGRGLAARVRVMARGW